MAKYTVNVTGKIYVVADFDVEAESEAEAGNLALQQASKADSIEWNHFTSRPESQTLVVEEVLKHGI